MGKAKWAVCVVGGVVLDRISEEQRRRCGAHGSRDPRINRMKLMTLIALTLASCNL